MMYFRQDRGVGLLCAVWFIFIITGCQPTEKTAKHTDSGDRPPVPGIRTIQGEVLRIEGENYFVKAQDGREVRVHANLMTMRLEKIQSGDRIKAEIDSNNHAIILLLSQRPNPTGK